MMPNWYVIKYETENGTMIGISDQWEGKVLTTADTWEEAQTIANQMSELQHVPIMDQTTPADH
jgi:hypothetical protein